MSQDDVSHIVHVLRVTQGIISQFTSPTSPVFERQEGRAGGYLCLAEGSNPPQLTVQLGIIATEEKAERYLRLAQEKVRRLLRHPHHTLSRQSANPSLEHYPGGVRGTRFRAAFSGFMADEDEILSAKLLFHLRDLNEEQYMQRLRTNPSAELLGRAWLLSRHDF